MTPELVSIFITTHNRAPALRDLLSRLVDMFAGELQGGTLEVWVFDDASTDDTPSVCSDFAPLIRSWRSEERVVAVEGRRRILAHLRGGYLVQFDDDTCFVDTSALTRIREVFRAHPRCGIIAANLSSPRDPAGLVPYGETLYPAGTFAGGGSALRATVARQVGFYPEFLTGYGHEEMALSLRVLDAGYSIFLDSGLRVHHAQDPSGRPPVRRAMGLVNELGIVLNMYPAFVALPALPYEFAIWLRATAREGTLGAALPAVPRLLPGVARRAFATRRPIRTRTLLRYLLVSWFERDAKREWASAATDADRWEGIESIFPSVRTRDSVPAAGRPAATS